KGAVARWSGADFHQSESLLSIPPNLLSPAALGWPPGVVFSPSGRFLAFGSTNGILEIQDLSKRALFQQIKVAAGRTWPVGFLAGDSKLAILLDDSALHEWDLRKRQETRSFPTNGLSGPFAFSKDERWFFTGGWDGEKGVLRDMTTGRESQVKFNINNIQKV